MSIPVFLLAVLAVLSWLAWYVRNNPALWVATFFCWVMALPTLGSQLWALAGQAWSWAFAG